MILFCELYSRFCVAFLFLSRSIASLSCGHFGSIFQFALFPVALCWLPLCRCRANELPVDADCTGRRKLIKINLRTRLCLCLITLPAISLSLLLQLMMAPGVFSSAFNGVAGEWKCRAVHYSLTEWLVCIRLRLLQPSALRQRHSTAQSEGTHQLSDWSNGRRTHGRILSRMELPLHRHHIAALHLILSLICHANYLACVLNCFFVFSSSPHFLLSPLIASSIHLFSRKASIC